ncbi:unnamed protein product [Pedinophyceae sp. YPF-701]|nr:unnamed protein product [Pedinophyceae sp. YPF-701]
MGAVGQTNAGWTAHEVRIGWDVRRSGRVINPVIEEAYLRDDISLRTELGTEFPDSVPRLSAQASHYAVLDTGVISDLLEVLELPEVEHTILPISALRAAIKAAGANIRRVGRIRALYRDGRRSTAAFDDLHHRQLAERARSRNTGHVAATPTPLDVAELYSAEIRGAIPVVVVSEAAASSVGLSADVDTPGGSDGAVPPLAHGAAAALRKLADVGLAWAAPSGGVWVMRPRAYFHAAYGGSQGGVLELYDAVVRAATERAAEDEAARAARDAGAGLPHLLPSEIESGLDSGELLQGTFWAERGRPFCGVLRLAAGSKSTSLDVVIPDKAASNRAIHGDVVAVRLVDVVGAGGGGDEDDADTDVGLASVAEGITFEEGVGGEVDETATVAGQQGRAQLTAVVVGVLQRAGGDIVASIDKGDEEALMAMDAAQVDARLEGVLCVPLDKRLPKVRLRSRNITQLFGKRLVLRIDRWDHGASFPQAHLVRVLGDIMDMKAESEAVMVANNVVWQPFCEGALRELPQDTPPDDLTAWQVPDSDAARRRDLRKEKDVFICSVDPIGCTDVDDALHARRLSASEAAATAKRLAAAGKGNRRPCFEIGVHIADVTHFVRRGGYLDGEARQRCTTVYLVDRRLDMLPGLLSGNLCSLVSNVDRLAVSVIWTLDEDFEPVDVWYGRTVIRSKYKLHYQQAQDILDGSDAPTPAPGTDTVAPADLPVVRDSLHLLASVASKLRAGRVAAGALELASAELRFETVGPDRTGAPSAVRTKVEIPMMGVVAEMMIFANAWVARRTHGAFPTCALLRRHPPPREKAFEEVREVLEGAGVTLDVSSNRALQESLDRAAAALKDPAAVVLVKAMATRAMSEAQYFSTGDAKESGLYHYGLALHHYTHFTSPIRRYADCIVHRQLLRAIGDPEDAEDAARSQERGTIAADAGGSGYDAAGIRLAADTMNERHRSSKHAQKECGDLYLLSLLHSQPLVEQAVVYALTNNTATVFVPRFHIRGRVPLTARDSRAAVLPEGHPAAGRAGLQLVTSGGVLTSGGPATDAKAVDAAGNVVWAVRLMDSVYVRLSAEASRTHGPRMRVQLLHAQHPDAVAAAEQARQDAAEAEQQVRVDFRKLYKEHKREREAAQAAASASASTHRDSQEATLASPDEDARRRARFQQSGSDPAAPRAALARVAALLPTLAPASEAGALQGPAAGPDVDDGSVSEASGVGSESGLSLPSDDDDDVAEVVVPAAGLRTGARPGQSDADLDLSDILADLPGGGAPMATTEADLDDLLSGLDVGAPGPSPAQRPARGEKVAAGKTTGDAGLDALLGGLSDADAKPRPGAPARGVNDDFLSDLIGGGVDDVSTTAAAAAAKPAKGEAPRGGPSRGKNRAAKTAKVKEANLAAVAAKEDRRPVVGAVADQPVTTSVPMATAEGEFCAGVRSFGPTTRSAGDKEVKVARKTLEGILQELDPSIDLGAPRACARRSTCSSEALGRAAVSREEVAAYRRVGRRLAQLVGGSSGPDTERRVARERRLRDAIAELEVASGAARGR